MPLRKRSQLKDQRVFFVTTSTSDHLRLFDEDSLKSSLLEIIKNCVKKHKADLYGYVVMSSHFHLMIRIEGGGPQLSRFMKDVKSISSRQQFPTKKGIWQHRFDDLAIFTEDQFRTKLSYIHQNPVKAGLVEMADEYKFSSAQDWTNRSKDSFVTTSFRWTTCYCQIFCAVRSPDLTAFQVPTRCQVRTLDTTQKSKVLTRRILCAVGCPHPTASRLQKVSGEDAWHHIQMT